MRKTPSIMTLCSIVLVNAACATPVETVVMPLEKTGWMESSVRDLNPGTHRELIPAGETSAAWTRMVTIQFHEGKKSPPEEALQQLKTEMATGCKNADWKILARDQYSILYEWRAISCGGIPVQHGVARLFRGNDGIHRIAYVEKVEKLSYAARDQWIRTFSAAYLEKGGRVMMFKKPRKKKQ